MRQCQYIAMLKKIDSHSEKSLHPLQTNMVPMLRGRFKGNVLNVFLPRPRITKKLMVCFRSQTKIQQTLAADELSMSIFNKTSATKATRTECTHPKTAYIENIIVIILLNTLVHSSVPPCSNLVGSIPKKP